MASQGQMTDQHRLDRRHFLECAGCGFGAVALQAMFADVARSAEGPLALRAPHVAPRAKRVIFLFMAGGPSQLDLFVPKPRLVQYHGQRVGVTQPAARDRRRHGKVSHVWARLARSCPRGDSGAMISNLMPHLAGVADELCFLHGMQVDNPAHDLATLQFNTGVVNEVRPSMGAWVSYGLGTENQNMPSYVSIHAGSDVRAHGSAISAGRTSGNRDRQHPERSQAIRHPLL